MRIIDWMSYVCASDLYSLVLELDPAVIAELVVERDTALVADLAPIRVGPTDVEVADSAMRLMRLLDRPASIPVLREQLVREMHYWLLAGQHGTAIRQDRKSTRLNSSH